MNGMQLPPLSAIDFDRASILVQIWGLPINEKTPQMGMKLGDRLGERSETGAYEMHGRTSIVKIKVKLHIKDLITPGMYIGIKTNGVIWIDYRYEKLPMFYFQCGLVGHNEDHFNNHECSKHGIE